MSVAAAGSSLRRIARKRTEEVLRRPRILATSAAVLVSVVGVIVGTAELSRITGHPWSPVILAFVLGVSVASVLWVLLGAVLFVDGSWTWRIGALGERSTAEALASLPRDWVVEHNIPFWYSDGRSEWDIDHVLIGPAGVIVIDTKWVSDPLDLSRPKASVRLQAATVAVLDQSSQIAKELGGRAGPVTATPALVVWGPRVAPIGLAAPAQVNGVSVVPGADLVAWLEQLPRHPLPPDVANAAAGVLTKRITDHQQWRSRRRADAAGRGRS